MKGATTCQTCPYGFYWENGRAELCDLGFYCSAGQKFICDPGTYGSKMGLSSQSECSPCPSGKFCTNGLISGDCQDGFYCRLGADRPDPPATTDCNDSKNAGPCPAGFFCSDQTNHIEVPCEPGMFSEIREVL